MVQGHSSMGSNPIVVTYTQRTMLRFRITEVTSYRDGGTISLKGRLIYKPNHTDDNHSIDKSVEICIDDRINTQTLGEWYWGHPSQNKIIDDEVIKNGVLAEFKSHIEHQYNLLRRLEDISST